MTRQSDLFDGRIADWLEADPDQAPDQALEVVLAAFPSIRQRRRGLAIGSGRTFPMTSTFKLALGAAAVVVVALGGLLLIPRASTGPGGGPSPAPVPSATPEPETTPSSTPLALADSPFVSERYGYSLRPPAGWTVEPATEDWTGLPGPAPFDPSGDRIRSGGEGDPSIVAAAQALPAGLSWEQWADQTKRAMAGTFGEGESGCGADVTAWQPATIAGRPAFVLETRCTLIVNPPEGVQAAPFSRSANLISAIFATEATGYTLGGELDRATFDAIAATFSIE